MDLTFLKQQNHVGCKEFWNPTFVWLPIGAMALPTHASSRAYVSTYFQLSCLHASSTTATKSLLQLLKLRGGKKSLEQTQYI